MKRVLFALLSFAILSCKTDSKDAVMVLVKYKTQANKNVEAVVALEALIDKVKKEEHFLQIKMYVDPNDNSNILLHEEWGDLNYYQNAHMQTEHIQGFIQTSAAFLEGPPEISFWKLKTVKK